jgi:hypothetical protein
MKKKEECVRTGHMSLLMIPFNKKEEKEPKGFTSF